MQNTLTNSTRMLVGLKPIDPAWKTIEKKTEHHFNEVYNITYFYNENTLHKVIYKEKDKTDEIQIECDTSIPLDDKQNILTKRGKTKPLTVWNSKQEKSKEPCLTINLTHKTALVECRVKWLPELPFTNLQTINKEIQSLIKEKYGETVWQKKVSDLLKKPKTRQTFKEGDIFCVRLGANQYAYGLLIGILAKLKKKDYWPSKNSGHYLTLQMSMPIIIRMFNFVSDKNDLTLEEIREYELLNPEIIMDASLLRGDYKIVAHKKLQEEDIEMPMHYSFYGKINPEYGLSTAAGLGCKNGKDARSIIEHFLPHYYQINITFNWGIASVEMNAHEFLQNKNNDNEFIDQNGISGGITGLNKNGQLINPHTIFSKEKIRSIFQTMKINCEPNFDTFNQKHGGITRKQYLESIK